MEMFFIGVALLVVGASAIHSRIQVSVMAAQLDEIRDDLAWFKANRGAGVTWYARVKEGKVINVMRLTAVSEGDAVGQILKLGTIPPEHILSVTKHGS
jgi:hypothetical protein